MYRPYGRGRGSRSRMKPAPPPAPPPQTLPPLDPLIRTTLDPQTIQRVRSTVDQLKEFKMQVEALLARPDYYNPQNLIDLFRSIETCQCLFPLEERIEIQRTIWLDLMRWSLIARITSGRKWRGNLFGLFLLLVDRSLNPWCNLAMATGKTCRNCLLVEVKAVKLAKTKIRAKDCYSNCLFTPSSIRSIREMQEGQQSELSILEPLNKLAKAQLTNGEAMRVWEHVTFGKKEAIS